VAARRPDRVALVEGVAEPGARRRWTYRELIADAEAVARSLLSRFQKGERIAVWAPGTPEWYHLELGTALAGLALVPISPAAREAEAEYVIGQAECSGVFVATEFRGAELAKIAAAIAKRRDHVREVICLDDWEAFIASGDPAAALPEVAAADPALMIYTSGTTGKPKGVLLSHGGIIANSVAMLARGEVAEGDVWLNPMPMFHSGGCIFVALGSLVCEGTMVQMASFDPDLALMLIDQERPVVTSCVPTMIYAMMERRAFPSTDVSSLAKSFTGGSSIPPELVRDVEARFGLNFVMTYGQTEGGPTISMSRSSDPLELKATTIGVPLDGYAVRIVDPVTGTEQPQDAVGELCISSPCTMIGYYNNPEETEKAIDSDGWLHTGDLCSLGVDGYLRHHGRLKDIIIRGGENISPREVEALIFSRPGVADVSVIGVPDKKYGEVVVAFVRPDPLKARPDSDELLAYCRANLASYKCPVAIWLVDELPLTPSGKTKKYELREWHRLRAAQPRTG
jgi:fatty-acyl-CoA synthase